MDESKDTVKKEDAAPAENASTASPSVHFSSLDLKLDEDLPALDAEKVVDTAQASVLSTSRRIRDRAFSMGSVVSYRNIGESSSSLGDSPLLKDSTTTRGQDSQNSAVSLSDDEDLLIMAALVGGENGRIGVDMMHSDTDESTEEIPDDVFDAMLLEHARQESLRTETSRSDGVDPPGPKDDTSNNKPSKGRARSLSLSLESTIVAIDLRDRAESLGFGLTELMMLEKSGSLPEVLGLSDLTSSSSATSNSRRPVLPSIHAPGTAYLSDDTGDSDDTNDGIGDGELATPLPVSKVSGSPGPVPTITVPPTLPSAPGPSTTPRRVLSKGPTTRTAAREALSFGLGAPTLPILSEPPTDIFAGTPYASTSDTSTSGSARTSGSTDTMGNTSNNGAGGPPKLKIRIKTSTHGARVTDVNTPRDGSLSIAHTPTHTPGGTYAYGSDGYSDEHSTSPTATSSSARERRTPGSFRHSHSVTIGDSKDPSVPRRVTRSQPLLAPYEPLDSSLDSPHLGDNNASGGDMGASSSSGTSGGNSRTSRRQATTVDPITAYLSTHGPSLGPVLTPSQLHAFSKSATLRPGIAIPISLNTAFDLQMHPAVGVFVDQDDRPDVNPREDTLSSFPTWQNAKIAAEAKKTKANDTKNATAHATAVDGTTLESKSPSTSSNTSTSSSTAPGIPVTPSPHPSIPGNPDDPQEYIGIWGARRLLRDAGSGRGPSLPTLSTAHPTAAAVAKHAVSLCKIHVHSIPFLCDCDSSDEEDEVDTLAYQRTQSSLTYLTDDGDSSADEEDNVLYLSRGSSLYTNLPQLVESVKAERDAPASASQHNSYSFPSSASPLDELKDKDEHIPCYHCEQRFNAGGDGVETDKDVPAPCTKDLFDITICYFCDKSKAAYVRYQREEDKRVLQKKLYARLKQLQQAGTSVSDKDDAGHTDDSATPLKKVVPNYGKQYSLHRETLDTLLSRMGDQNDVLSNYLVHHHIYQQQGDVAKDDHDPPVHTTPSTNEPMKDASLANDTVVPDTAFPVASSSVSSTSDAAMSPGSSDPSNLSCDVPHAFLDTRASTLSEGEMDPGFLSSGEESWVSLTEIEELAEHYRALYITDDEEEENKSAMRRKGKQKSRRSKSPPPRGCTSNNANENENATNHAIVDKLDDDGASADLISSNDTTAIAPVTAGPSARSYLPSYLQLPDIPSDATSSTIPSTSNSPTFTLFDYYKQQASLANIAASNTSLASSSATTRVPYNTSRSQTLHAFSRSLSDRLPRGCTLLVGGVYETSTSEEALPVLLPLASGVPLRGTVRASTDSDKEHKNNTQSEIPVKEEREVAVTEDVDGSVKGSETKELDTADDTKGPSSDKSSSINGTTTSPAPSTPSYPVLHSTHHSGFTILHPQSTDSEDVSPSTSIVDTMTSDDNPNATDTSPHTRALNDIVPAASALPGLSLIVVHYRGRAFLRPVVTGPEPLVARSLQAILGLGIERSNTLLSPHRNLSGRKSSNAITYANQPLAIPSAPPALDFAEQPYHTAVPASVPTPPSTPSTDSTDPAPTEADASSWLTQMQQSFVLALKRSTSNRLVHSLKRKSMSEPLPWMAQRKTYTERPFLPVLTSTVNPVPLYPAFARTTPQPNTANDGQEKSTTPKSSGFVTNDPTKLPPALYKAFGLSVPTAVPTPSTTTEIVKDTKTSETGNTSLSTSAPSASTSTITLPPLTLEEQKQLQRLQDTLGPVLLTADARPAIASRTISRAHLADLTALGVPPAEVLNPICILTYLHCRRIHNQGQRLPAVELFQNTLLRIKSKYPHLSSDTASDKNASELASTSLTAEQLPLVTDVIVLRALLASEPGTLTRAVLAGRTPSRWSAGLVEGQDTITTSSSALSSQLTHAGIRDVHDGVDENQERFNELGKRMAVDKDRRAPATKRSRT